MNATVTLPISELDALRDGLKTWKEKAETLQKTEKQVKLVLVRRDPYAVNTYSEYNERAREWYRYSKVEPKDQVVSATYENLQEVEKILYLQAQEKVQSELDSVLIAAKNTKEDFKEKLEEKDKEIAKLKGEQIDKEKDEIIEKLKESLEDLSKVNADLIEKVNSMHDKYIKEYNLPWYKKIFR